MTGVDCLKLRRLVTSKFESFLPFCVEKILVAAGKVMTKNNFRSTDGSVKKNLYLLSDFSSILFSRIVRLHEMVTQLTIFCRYFSFITAKPDAEVHACTILLRGPSKDVMNEIEVRGCCVFFRFWTLREKMMKRYFAALFHQEL